MSNFGSTDNIERLVVPSDTEQPISSGFLTKRSLCTNTPENSTLLDRWDKIQVITDLSYDLKEIDNIKDAGCVIAEHMDELQEVFNINNITECSSDLFTEEYKIITDVNELKQLLSEVLIRFDTDPCNYKKDDYGQLLKILYQSLLYLYTAYVDRSQSDWDLTDNTKPDYIKNKPEILQSDWNQTDTTKIDYIKNKPEAGENITFENGKINAKDTTYSAGENITINSSNVISAKDTTYTAGTGINIDTNNLISVIDVNHIEDVSILPTASSTTRTHFYREPDNDLYVTDKETTVVPAELKTIACTKSSSYITTKEELTALLNPSGTYFDCIENPVTVLLNKTKIKGVTITPIRIGTLAAGSFKANIVTPFKGKLILSTYYSYNGSTLVYQWDNTVVTINGEEIQLPQATTTTPPALYYYDIDEDTESIEISVPAGTTEPANYHRCFVYGYQIGELHTVDTYTWTQIASVEYVNAEVTELEESLGTTAFSNDYWDLDNLPDDVRIIDYTELPTPSKDYLKIIARVGGEFYLIRKGSGLGIDLANFEGSFNISSFSNYVENWAGFDIAPLSGITISRCQNNTTLKGILIGSRSYTGTFSFLLNGTYNKVTVRALPYYQLLEGVYDIWDSKITVSSNNESQSYTWSYIELSTAPEIIDIVITDWKSDTISLVTDTSGKRVIIKEIIFEQVEHNDTPVKAGFYVWENIHKLTATSKKEIVADFAWWQKEYANYGSKVLLTKSHTNAVFDNFYIELYRLTPEDDGELCTASITISVGGREELRFSKVNGHLLIESEDYGTEVNLNMSTIEFLDYESTDPYPHDITITYSIDNDEASIPLYFRIYRQIKQVLAYEMHEGLIQNTKTYLLYSEPIDNIRKTSKWKYLIIHLTDIRCLRHWLKVTPSKDAKYKRSSWRVYPECLDYSSLHILSASQMIPYYIRGKRQKSVWHAEDELTYRNVTRTTFKWFINPEVRNCKVEEWSYVNLGNLNNLAIHYILHDGKWLSQMIGNQYVEVIVFEYRPPRKRSRRGYIKSTGVKLKIRFNRNRNTGRSIKLVQANVLPFHQLY